ncbi:Homeobox protein 4 [Trichoderma ghanense]|uniref:Homeobox protein 4 n=1 Tax=Trichoderma ghanense TaxID=65468 RepID=A0ABY2HAJ3_9HYPO
MAHLATMDPDEFIDFSDCIDGTAVPNESCESCTQQHIHCRVTSENIPLGVCTPCMESARVCSLTIARGAVEGQTGAFTNDHQNMPQQLAGHTYSRSECSFTINESQGEDATDHVERQPKAGARFSREALRILRNWLTSNHRHPYPSNEDKENLARQTGLNKTQIANWVANARRRGKVRAPRSTSSSPGRLTVGIDIPPRVTPLTREMSPMERWRSSPPDQEPASISAIATAVSSSELLAGAHYRNRSIDDGLAGSIDRLSSAGSSRTSHSSNGSLSTVNSHNSRESLVSLSSIQSRGRRRRRRETSKAVNISSMLPTIHTYQCTFCTETFKTKHDWQRHEKSLHLSLERWVCSPDGPIQFCAEWNCLACVYCGLKNPTQEHAEQHNDFVCAEKSEQEKTFYRNDHLRQHLNIVHDAKFQKWPMSDWKVSTPPVRSRCGFCGLLLDSWDARVGHLAQHFKNGKSMADWRGDWGFPEEILRIVENGMPPYLIHHERNTLDPFEASRGDIKCGKDLEDYVKLWLVDYVNDRTVSGMAVTDGQLLLEAQRIVQKVDTEDTSPTGPAVSWFRDLIMLHRPSYDTVNEGPYTTSKTAAWTAQIEKLHASKCANSDLGTLGCEKEKMLLQYVKSRQTFGQPPTDAELQFQACRILEDVEPKSNFKCKEAVQWFKFLINSSTHWLSDFKRRAGNLTVADQLEFSGAGAAVSLQALHWGLSDETIGTSPMTAKDSQPSSSVETPQSTSSQSQPLRYFLSDANCYGRLEKELTQFVTSCLSPNNPLQHIPTDEELQYQARWIIYDDDDPWNQTAADNAEWLARFKRDTGLVTSDGVNGLAAAGPPRPWRIKDGGTGFMPPFVKPKAGATIEVTEDSPVYIDYRLYNVGKDTAERYIRALCEGEYQPPPSVFCSRELEHGLNAYIEECIKELYVPSDDDLRSKAREILGVESTAADDPKLLEAFKAMHALWNTQVNGTTEFMSDGHANNSNMGVTGGVNDWGTDTEQMNAFDLLSNTY